MDEEAAAALSVFNESLSSSADNSRFIAHILLTKYI